MHRSLANVTSQGRKI